MFHLSKSIYKSTVVLLFFVRFISIRLAVIYFSYFTKHFSATYNSTHTFHIYIEIFFSFLYNSFFEVNFLNLVFGIILTQVVIFQTPKTDFDALLKYTTA